MEVQNEHGLLVVSLDNCMTSDTCELGKTNTCVYTAAMTSGACGPDTSVVQLAAPISDLRQTIPSRMQHHHLTQLQPIQYSQTVSYEPSQQIQHNGLISNHTLYQPMTVSTAPLHTYTPTNPYMNNPTLPLLTPSPSFPSSAPTMEDMATSTESIEPTDILRTSVELPEPTYPAEGFDYFLEIQNLLVSEQYPPNVSENYAKCLKKRAQNYLMINGKLYHNRKQPKEVIMRRDQQEDMLSDIHVVKETGIHLGVKKMFNKLHMEYFWRGMYTDVVNFVKKCDKCSDQLDPTTVLATRPCLGSLRELEGESEDTDSVEDPVPLSHNSSSPNPHRGDKGRGCRSAVRVWRKVEVELHGPYSKTTNNNEYIATMSDPDSRWCCARAIPGCDHAELLSDFIFHEFCNFGFARCSLVGCATELVKAVHDIYVTRVTKLGEMFGTVTVNCLDQQQSSCSWVDPLLDRLVQAHPNKWDKYLDHFLFQYRIGELKEFTPFSLESPFSFLFYHSPLSFTLLDEDKENIDRTTIYKLRRRKPQSRLLQCRHCTTLFSSKISLRFHQRRHQGESYRKHLTKKRVAKCGDITSLTNPVGQQSGCWRESTISAVKALLVATKEERRRRGKYHKYSVELQEQMAVYAMKHGNTSAVRYFSEKLGTVVSESTIRNLVKIYSAFTSTTKDEIGRFAVNYGIEPAAKYFSERLKRDVSQSLVRKFKVMYLNRHSSDAQKQKEGGKFTDIRMIKSSNRTEVLRGKRYTVKIKQEIGEYASNHSIKDTVDYFTEKLQIPVKERTVKRFYKMYVDKSQSNNTDQEVNNQEIQVLEPMNCGNQETMHVNVYSTLPQNNPVSLYQLNQHTIGSNMCYQAVSSASVITTQSNYHQSLQNFSSTIPTVTIPAAPQSYPIALINNQISPEKPSIASINIQPDNQEPQNIIPQHSLIVTQDRNSPLLPHFLATQPLQPTILTLISEKEPQKIKESQDLIGRNDMQTNFNSEGYQESLPIVTDLLTHQEKQEMLIKSDPKHSESSDFEEGSPVLRKTQCKNHNKKKDRGSKKRGTYTTYSPEIRAEIGKYAAEHGSLKACQHFAKILGHDVPESTARGLREKYLMKKKHCQVTSLGYSPRGRPLRLGKYDELVQECIKELVRSGEKVSSFLAITTAKEILNKYEPELLEENGGSLKLNITWAKSFLKRIGVHNNS